MSHGKQLLGQLFTLALLSQFAEDDKKENKFNKPKPLDDLLNDIFGKPTEAPKKQEATKQTKGTLFNEILEDVTKESDQKFIDSIIADLKETHAEEIKFIGANLLPCNVEFIDGLNFLNTNLEVDTDTNNEFNGERIYYSRISGGFGLAYLGGSVHYICFTKDKKQVILFDDRKDFYYGANKCTGLKDKIKNDYLSGKLK